MMHSVQTERWIQQLRHVKSVFGKSVFFVLILASLFNYPYYPHYGLDPSWAMALSQFFHDGLQFGPEVAFTYGPLGFLLSNTYIDLPFWSFILSSLLVASVCTIVIIDSAQFFAGIRRVMYLVFFVFSGNLSADALYLMLIATIGFKFIRRSGVAWQPSTIWFVLFLALLGSIKFTFFTLAAFAVILTCLQELVQGRWHIALRFAVYFCAAFLALWKICGQSLYNVPVYFYNSWQISQGYEQAMGLSTPVQTFWLGVAVLATLAAYALLYLVWYSGKRGTLVHVALLVAFVYLVWKHGFVRSDAHMFTFFIGALLPPVAFPGLLDNLPNRHRSAQLLLVCTAILCVWGIHSTSIQNKVSNIILQVPSQLHDKFWHHAMLLGQWAALRASYEHEWSKEKQRFDLPRTRQVVGQAPIDVLGYEQAITLYNGFTYRPRPVFQSYSAYTTYLARLNDHFYRSKRAPDYVLLKLQTIDGRFPTLDDSLVLRSFVQYYDYVHVEKGFQLWQRRTKAFLEGQELESEKRSETVRLNQPVRLDEFRDKRVWATLQIQPSLLGRLRNIVYKPPIIHFAVEDTQGRRLTFRLTVPQAATGFILNPLLENSLDYLCFAMGTAHRQVQAFTLEVAKRDAKFLRSTAHLELSELPPVTSGQDCRGLVSSIYFWMFSSYPIRYEAVAMPSESQIGGRPAAMMHAPSTMEFTVPEAATSVSGAFGFAEGAYSGEGTTDGAIFRVLWQDDKEHRELYARRLDPLHVPGDRGLQDFYVDLKGYSGGKVILAAEPGTDNRWDWTYWTAIKIE